jgi:hypothetical protein
MAGRRQRRTVAGWLGLVALAVQAFLPLLVAAEISAAASAGDRSVFELCAFGHVHAAQPGDETPATPASHDESDGKLCPICIALHAGPAFTAPPPLALQLPAPPPAAFSLPARQQAPPVLALTAYRSRAPPIG